MDRSRIGKVPIYGKGGGELRNHSEEMSTQLTKESEEGGARFAETLKHANGVKAALERESPGHCAVEEESSKRHKVLVAVIEQDKDSRYLQISHLGNRWLSMERITSWRRKLL